MNATKLIEKLDELQDKLDIELTKLSALRQKTKYTKLALDESLEREMRSRELMTELLERQGELHVMLDRANRMLHRSQEAMAATTSQFNQMFRELPDSKRDEWTERLNNVRQVFIDSGNSSLSMAALDWDFSLPRLRTCSRCGKQTRIQTAACPSCYAPLLTLHQAPLLQFRNVRSADVPVKNR